MSAARVRLLPYAVADGPHNMAADETLLEAAGAGTASLRFYGWSEATVSLGYFQPERVVRDDPRLAPLPFVRRPTGGMTLVHHHELTYALALPAGSPWQTRTQQSQPWLCRMHAILAAALKRLGVAACAASCAVAAGDGGPLCFRTLTPGDLVIANAKVVGSAQRRQRGALLQHGAVLLAMSPHAAVLPGIRELSGRQLESMAVVEGVCTEWERQTGWGLDASAWSAPELGRIEELVQAKYASPAWNRKR